LFSTSPGLLAGCQVIWMCDWSKDTLIGEAEFFLETPTVPKNMELLRYFMLNVSDVLFAIFM
jgi:hypothetical protein